MNYLPSEAKKSSTLAITADRVISSLFDATYTVERRIEESLDTVGLSWPKWDLLTTLVQAPETLSLGELASRMTCVRSNITQLVDRLEADGLVRREEDPQDRRAVRAALTPLGRKRQAAGGKLIDSVQEELIGALSELDRVALESALLALGTLATQR